MERCHFALPANNKGEEGGQELLCMQHSASSTTFLQMTGPWNQPQDVSSERVLPPVLQHLMQHTAQGCHSQVSPSDPAAVPHLQKLALNTPQKAVRGPVWLWNDEEASVSMKMFSSIPYTPGATINPPSSNTVMD